MSARSLVYGTILSAGMWAGIFLVAFMIHGVIVR